jgi:glycerate-2-kinase
MTPLATLARQCFAAALEAVHPRQVLRQVTFTAQGVRFGSSALEPEGAFLLVGLGKAGATMASAALRQAVRKPQETFILVPQGAPVPQEVQAFTRYGTHPGVSEENARAAAELLHLLAHLSPADGVLLLLSGGSSALLSLPLEGVKVEELDALTRKLLQRGATIHQLNTVRKHLTQTLGGRLAAACPGQILALVLSDVPDNDLSVVASGPTVPDTTTAPQAAAVLRRFGLASAFPQLVQLLEGEACETPKPGDARLSRALTLLLASNKEALEAARRFLVEAGFRPQVLTPCLRGEAREVGRALGAAIATAAPGTALLAAGETTVTVKGKGQGGRNLELALAAACELAGLSHRCLLAAATDGVDGSSPAAGAVVDGQTLGRAQKAGKDPGRALRDNNSWDFFAPLPEAILTGPTGTNVADLVIALSAPVRKPTKKLPKALWQQPTPSPPGLAKGGGP